MQTSNANPLLTVTVRHEEVTDALREYAKKKIEGLHLDYPRILEPKAILDAHKKRHSAEIILFCANHITIQASTEGEDMYAALDETAAKIARRMRKQKTRLLKKKRPHRNESIRHLDESVFSGEALEAALDHPDEAEKDPEPCIVHKEAYRLRTMYKEDAIMELELSDRPFVLYRSARRGCLTILYRRSDGEYASIDITEDDLK
jgi:putative sigma-54 modulation protein